jgi:diguanylate cyclase (GGDEF)-like protein/PAS domain S-box-containing protein
MPTSSKLHLKQLAQVSTSSATERRQNIVHILFVSSFVAEVERCLRELKRVQFKVSSDIVVTPEQFVERLKGSVIDLIVAEHPDTNWQETLMLDLLAEAKGDIPIIFLVQGLKREAVAELLLKGVAECVDRENLGHLPVAIHRALREKVLSEQRDRAEQALRRSEAHYRALAGNLSYGICRCSVDGKFLEVNDTMVNMLGYATREELLALHLAQDVIRDPGKRVQLLGPAVGESEIDPIEIEWKRKNDVVLKVRLSGREVLGEHGALEAYEVIVENVTRQRQLEEHLRRQAASDSLTGLANYRHLVDVLDSEIKRSQRTNREFAILFFDLDDLKRINDRYGHMAGSHALCRFADVLSGSCRDIDTPARFGGDEFALILPETSLDAAIRVSERICESIGQENKGPSISACSGIAVYPQDGDSIETLLKHADSELYRMKRLKTARGEARQTAAGS